ncbi:MAG: 3-deoxy-D-manno-octulosonic acid transferase [Nitrospinota bacterium]|nr:3-deoxy-D-manno-octulosonic acid transferase [Nitrospinota bacterium]HJM42121.1 3-deoxy-D-manno-octulosonic acid transferase [Nitrospinota bacterium]
MYFLYNLLLAAGLPFLAAYWIFQALFRGKVRRGLRDRLGFPDLSAAPGDAPTVWLHAVSVGEVHAAAPFVQALKRKLPGWRFVLSTVTETGREAGVRRIPEADARIYFPLDLPGPVAAAVRRVKPRLVVILETEIWPNFLWRLFAEGIPTVIVNGRVSPRSFRRYLRVRPLMARALAKVTGFGAQSEADARRVTRLGAPPERVRVMGNLKFDGAAESEPPGPEEKTAIRKALGLSGDAPVWVAGSVHPREEAPVVDAYRSLLKTHPSLQLVLAPRHPNRARAIADLLRGRKVPHLLRKGGSAEESARAPVLVLNTMGDLVSAYRAGDVSFVGGSLFPWGGQNPLEPAGLGIPVLFGEHMQNFEEAARALMETPPGGESAALQIGGSLDGAASRLAEAVGRVLDSPETARAMGERGRRVVRAQAGAAERYADWVAEISAGRTRA